MDPCWNQTVHRRRACTLCTHIIRPPTRVLVNNLIECGASWRMNEVKFESRSTPFFENRGLSSRLRFFFSLYAFCNSGMYFSEKVDSWLIWKEIWYSMKLLRASFLKMFSIDRYNWLSIFPILKNSAKIVGFSEIKGDISGMVERFWNNFGIYRYIGQMQNLGFIPTISYIWCNVFLISYWSDQ